MMEGLEVLHTKYRFLWEGGGVACDDAVEEAQTKCEEMES